LPNSADPLAAELLKRYSKQFDKDPLTADRSLLDQTRERLKAELQRQPLSSELVHLAVRLHWNWDTTDSSLTSLLAAYLQQPLPVEEEAWARYECVNSLTGPEQSEELVKQQRAALVWARERWQSGQLASESWLHLICNSSQAQRWSDLGLRDEWLTLLTDLLATIPPNAANRMERFYALRTACLMLQGDDRSRGDAHL
jgi:hypothetical protein